MVWKRLALVAGAIMLLGVGVTGAYLAGRQSGGQGSGLRPAAAIKRAATLPVLSPSPAITPPPPSPVSTAANLSGTCVPGVEDATINSFYSLSSIGSGAVIPAGDTTYGAYQVTLENRSSVTAEVTGLAVVFYDSSGNETGSDKQGGFDSFITPGQSLTWTEIPWTSVTNAPFAAGQDGAVDTQATCQLVQWYHP